MSRPPARPLALITGASAGIGAALAEVYAAHGWDLALTARREERLVALADALGRRHGVAVAVLPLDLAAPDATLTLLDALAARGLSPDGLVNNAGFSRVRGFLAIDAADHAAMLRVMLTAPVALSRALLPAMVARGYGRILNVASLAGDMPATGGDTLYGPIKSFLIKASQGLHLELRDSGVHVTALCPGYTRTEFHDANGTRDQVAGAYPAWMWRSADHVARVGYAACEANRPRVTPGAINTLLGGLAKHLPDALALRMVGGHAQRLQRL